MLPMLLARALESGPRETIKAPKALESKIQATPRYEQSKPILIVDDSLTIRTHLRSLLHSFGFAVIESDNAEDVLASPSLTPYACVLMDVLMPGMGGYEACRRIKALGRTGNSVPVVMLTSKTSPFDHIRGKMAGCDAYLNKPVNPNELLAALSRHVLPAASNRVIQRPMNHNTVAHQFVAT
jgi:twitching motility two-component system response regulator PilG